MPVRDGSEPKWTAIAGVSMKNKKTAAIARELRRIAKANGGLLLPTKVVEAARPKSSPLHSRFEWDNSEAAENYRLWQARQLIRVIVETVPGMSGTTEVFVSLSKDRVDGRGYRVTTEVCRDEDLRAQLLEDALTELEIFKLKYRRLKELAEVFEAIETVKKK